MTNHNTLPPVPELDLTEVSSSSLTQALQNKTLKSVLIILGLFGGVGAYKHYHETAIISNGTPGEKLELTIRDLLLGIEGMSDRSKLSETLRLLPSDIQISHCQNMKLKDTLSELRKQVTVLYEYAKTRPQTEEGKFSPDLGRAFRPSKVKQAEMIIQDNLLARFIGLNTKDFEEISKLRY